MRLILTSLVGFLFLSIAANAQTCPANTTAPSISGTPQVGQTLSVVPGTWTNSPVSFFHQWYRNTSPPTPIPGETSTSHIASASDVGFTISVQEVVSNSSGATQITSPPTSVTSIVGGSLSGTVTNSSGAVNLTSGTADWAHWYGYDHKASGGGQIGNFSIVGSGSASNYGNDLRPISWTDGTPTGSATNNTNGVYIAGIGKGFSVTAPADTTTRTVNLYVGGWQSGGKLVAHLSDGSAADFVDTTPQNGSGQYDGNYTITYHAASSGQTLTLTWTQNSGTGNVTLNAAALH